MVQRQTAAKHKALPCTISWALSISKIDMIFQGKEKVNHKGPKIDMIFQGKEKVNHKGPIKQDLHNLEGSESKESQNSGTPRNR